MQKANKHIPHISEYLLRNPGSFPNIINTTIKYDGSPSVVIGKTDEYFVSTKSFFNKIPKIYHSMNEINSSNMSEELKNKMCVLYKAYEKVEFEGVYQGDILFTPTSISKENINGKSYITFHPNTIVYAISEEYEDYETVLGSDIGVAWHTRYRGEHSECVDRNSAKALQKEKALSLYPPLYTNVTKLFENIFVSNMEIDEDILDLIFKRRNYDISLFLQVYNEIHTEIEKSVTSKRKEKWKDMLYRLNPKKIHDIDILDKKITKICKEIMQKTTTTGLYTFLKMNNKYIPTTHEGLVITTPNDRIKIVDKMEFSRANFSELYTKGFTR